MVISCKCKESIYSYLEATFIEPDTRFADNMLWYFVTFFYMALENSYDNKISSNIEIDLKYNEISVEINNIKNLL